MNEELLEFYTKEGKDAGNRTFREIINFDAAQFENIHDYIQWVFPTETVSKFNLDAPVLDDITIFALNNSSVFKNRFNTMAKVFVDDFLSPSYHWRWPENHNLLRLTRLFESSVLFGNRGKALNVFDQIIKYDLVAPTPFITGKTLSYWRKALQIDS